MNTGKNYEENRDSLPMLYWPDQLETVSTMPLSLGTQGIMLAGMTGMAIGASQQTLEGLLDPEKLRSAYETAYRLIFARSMVEILDQRFSKSNSLGGSTVTVTTAIVVVPVFTYIVQGILGFVSLCSIALIIISIRRKWRLNSDPATIASVMALVADNPVLLEDFAKLDDGSKEGFEKSLKDRKFQLEYNARDNTYAHKPSHHSRRNNWTIRIELCVESKYYCRGGVKLWLFTDDIIALLKPISLAH